MKTLNLQMYLCEPVGRISNITTRIHQANSN